jgi:hypothetical protein
LNGRLVDGRIAVAAANRPSPREIPTPRLGI